MTEHGVKIWNTLMDEAVFRIKQRNNFTTVELTFHRDYVEYCLISGRGKAVGFNVRYELLPNEFDYRTYHPKDQFVRRPLIIIAFLTPFELLKKNANPLFCLGHHVPLRAAFLRHGVRPAVVA